MSTEEQRKKWREAWHKRDKAKLGRYYKQDYQYRLEKWRKTGQCVRCKNMTDGTKTECQTCSDKTKLKSVKQGKKTWIERKEANRCVRCNSPMGEIDIGYLTCINCRERLCRGQI